MDYSKLKVNELRQLIKDNTVMKIRGFSKMKKEELIKLLIDNDGIECKEQTKRSQSRDQSPEKKESDDKILNPATGKYVKKSGKIGKALLKKQTSERKTRSVAGRKRSPSPVKNKKATVKSTERKGRSAERKRSPPNRNCRSTERKYSPFSRRLTKTSYEVFNQLGETGKDGSTFLVRYNGVEYAMKTFKKSKSSKNIEKEGLFQILASYSGVVPRVFDINPEEKYIVMEKMDYRLLDLIQQNQITKEEVIADLYHVAEKLDETDVVQNDPNIRNFMYKNGKMYVLDFGFAIPKRPDWTNLNAFSRLVESMNRRF
jgi:predicted Ser/Thr protein kinase